MFHNRYLPFAGRLLIGGIFMMSGLSKIAGFKAIAGLIAAAGLPEPSLGTAVAIAVEIGLGLLMVLGLRVRITAVLLAFWCALTAVLFHANFADQNAMINFLKNLMIIGGLLQIVYFGAGALSLDSRTEAHP